MHRIMLGTWRRLSNTVLSALTAVYAVRSTMTALGAHIGAKLHRDVAWVHLHKLDDHCSCAHGAMRGRHRRQPFFRSHMIPFRGRINQGMGRTLFARQSKRPDTRGQRSAGRTSLQLCRAPAGPGAPPSFSRLAIAGDGAALVSKKFVMHGLWVLQ